MRYPPLLVLTATVSAPALAVPITIDITGVITQYVTYEGLDQIDRTSSLTNPHVTASITYDRDLAPAPQVDFFTNMTRLEHTSSSPPLVEFASGSFTWQNGTFVPETPLDIPADGLVLGDTLQLSNFFDADDGFIIGDIAAYGAGLSSFQQGVILGFFGDFLPGTEIPSGSELPDFATASGQFQIWSVILDDIGGAVTGGGFLLNGDVTSATARIAYAVPEPTTAMLMLAGFVGFGILRRQAPRRRRR